MFKQKFCIKWGKYTTFWLRYNIKHRVCSSPGILGSKQNPVVQKLVWLKNTRKHILTQIQSYLHIQTWINLLVPYLNNQQKWCDWTNSSIISPRNISKTLWSPFKMGQMEQSDTDVPWPLGSAWMVFNGFLGSFSTIHTMYQINPGLHFFLWPHPGRLATVPWTIYFLIILAAVVRVTWSCLDIVL